MVVTGRLHLCSVAVQWIDVVASWLVVVVLQLTVLLQLLQLCCTVHLCCMPLLTLLEGVCPASVQPLPCAYMMYAAAFGSLCCTCMCHQAYSAALSATIAAPAAGIW